MKLKYDDYKGESLYIQRRNRHKRQRSNGGMVKREECKSDILIYRVLCNGHMGVSTST